MLLIIYICNMNLKEKTKVKVLMLLSVQMFLESHDELKGTTDYANRLKFTANNLKKELIKSFGKQIDPLFRVGESDANGIIGDIENYVEELIKNIKVECSRGIK